MAGIGGIATGINSAELINQLMKVEANQQTLLGIKKTTQSNVISALQGINARVASLAELAAKAAKPESWALVKGTASSESVTVTSGANAGAGTLALQVDAVATAQSSMLQVPADIDPADPRLTLRTAGGDPVTITAVSTDPRDIAAAINKADAGVTATIVNLGTAGAPDRRIQLTATQTGAGHGFTVDVATTSGTRPADLVELTAASDARITLYPGTAGATTVTSASNTFSDVLDDVSITVSTVTTEPVDVTLTRDSEALTKMTKDLVNTLNIVLDEISARTKASKSTNDDGSEGLKGGVLTGESMVRTLATELLSTASTTVGGASLASVGISIDRSGRFTFDEKTFTDALAADPGKAQKLVAGLAGAAESVATRASDKTNGTLTLRIKGGEGTVRELEDRILGWNDRLAVRRATLERTYAALEVTISRMNATSSWLEAQISQMNAGASK